MTKTPPRRRKTAYRSLRGICRRLGVKLVIGGKSREYDWGRPVGKEVW